MTSQWRIKFMQPVFQFVLINLRRSYGILLDLSNGDFDLDHPDVPFTWGISTWNKPFGCEGASFDEIKEFCINIFFVNGTCAASLLSWVEPGGLILYIRSAALEMEQSATVISIAKINTCTVSILILDIHLENFTYFFISNGNYFR